MAFRYFDRVKETSTSTGTGNITLAGAASGFRTFSSVYSNADTMYYCITEQNGTAWEVGIGTYHSSGTTLSRTTVKSSSNSNSAVNFTSGALYVFVTPVADGLPTEAGASGTGKMVLTNNPALIAPDIGAATGTSAKMVQGSGTLDLYNNVLNEYVMSSNSYTTLGVFDGSRGTPSTTTNPGVYIQRHFSGNAPQGAYDQNIGGLYCDTEIYGSGSSSSPNVGGSLGGLFVTNANNPNLGAGVTTAFGYKGDIIGLAGFAYNTGVSAGHITTGIWGWAKGPTLTSTEFAYATTLPWTICGMEINVSYDHPDIGVGTYPLRDSGGVIGYLCTNYRQPGTGLADWQYGMAFIGTPVDGDYSNLGIDNWNGYHTGIFIDQIKNYGIRFGQSMKTGAYGISFPTSWTGDEPSAGIYMGAAKFNIGDYSGSTFNNGDIWQHGGNLYYRQGSTTQQIITSSGGGSLGITTATSINFTGFNVPANGMFLATTNILAITSNSTNAHIFVNPASAVNYLATIGATTGNYPLLIAAGSNSNVSLGLASQGTNSVKILTNAGAGNTIAQQGEFLHAATTTNWVTFLGSNGGNAVIGTNTAGLSISSDTIFSTGKVTSGFSGTTGKFIIQGGTSGTCTITVPSVAGTSTNFRLPANNGTNGYLLQTDGSGNTSWTAAGSGVGDALVANPLSQFAATTSAQLAGVLSDETGSGLAVFNNTPTIITPSISVITAPTTAGVSIAGNTDGNPISSGNKGETQSISMPTTTANTVTITIAVPGVVTHSISNLALGQAVNFFNSGGALPTGITAGVNYFPIPITSTTCWLATSIANAFAGTKITTSGSQSGTQFMNSSASPTSGVTFDICALNSPSGNWDLNALVRLNQVNSAVVTVTEFSLGTTSATLASPLNNGGYAANNGYTSPASSTYTIPLPPKPFNPSSTTITYLCGKITFSPGNVNAAGVINGRRW